MDATFCNKIERFPPRLLLMLCTYPFGQCMQKRGRQSCNRHGIFNRRLLIVYLPNLHLSSYSNKNVKALLKCPLFKQKMLLRDATAVSCAWRSSAGSAKSISLLEFDGARAALKLGGSAFGSGSRAFLWRG